METVLLDILAEQFSGEIALRGMPAIEQEGLRRISTMYSLDEIAELKQNTPPHFKPQILSYIEILVALIAFQKKKYTPDTSELRKDIRG